jgi:hypothetical protein
MLPHVARLSCQSMIFELAIKQANKNKFRRFWDELAEKTKGEVLLAPRPSN